MVMMRANRDTNHALAMARIKAMLSTEPYITMSLVQPQSIGHLSWYFVWLVSLKCNECNSFGHVTDVQFISSI